MRSSFGLCTKCAPERRSRNVAKEHRKIFIGIGDYRDGDFYPWADHGYSVIGSEVVFCKSNYRSNWVKVTSLERPLESRGAYVSQKPNRGGFALRFD